MKLTPSQVAWPRRHLVCSARQSLSDNQHYPYLFMSGTHAPLDVRGYSPAGSGHWEYGICSTNCCHCWFASDRTIADTTMFGGWRWVKPTISGRFLYLGAFERHLISHPFRFD